MASVLVVAGPVRKLVVCVSLQLQVRFPGPAHFFHQLTVTDERMNTEYWLTV